MENHIKTCMLIEKKVYVVHIKTSISTMEKTRMLTTETRKKMDMLYILKLVYLLLKYKKDSVLHILKIVCLLQK